MGGFSLVLGVNFVKQGQDSQEGRPGSLLLSPTPPLSSDDSDYDEAPEEGLGAPTGVMKVGQMVVRVWAVCRQCERWAAQLPFRPWGPADREWATIPGNFPYPFIVLPCRDQGSDTGSQVPVLGRNLGVLVYASTSSLQQYLDGCDWPLLSLGVLSTAVLEYMLICLCFTFCFPISPSF